MRMATMEIHVPDEVAQMIKSLISAAVGDADVNDLLAVNTALALEITRMAMECAISEDEDETRLLAQYLLATQKFSEDMLKSLDPVIVETARKFLADRIEKFEELTARADIQEDFFRRVQNE